MLAILCVTCFVIRCRSLGINLWRHLDLLWRLWVTKSNLAGLFSLVRVAGEVDAAMNVAGICCEESAHFTG
jgi:hypothetical protein